MHCNRMISHTFQLRYDAVVFVVDKLLEGNRAVRKESHSHASQKLKFRIGRSATKRRCQRVSFNSIFFERTDER